MEKKYPVSQLFFSQACGIDGLSLLYQGTGAILIPPKSKYYYMPHIVIKDMDTLERALQNYLLVVAQTNILFTKLDDRHDSAYFLGILIKNLTNEDYLCLEEYVHKFTQFILDDTFCEYDSRKCIGNLNAEYQVEARRFSEFYGAETPFAMKFFKRNKHIQYELPLVRYGIYEKNGEKVVRIYMVQTKRIYKDTEEVKTIKLSLNAVNSGVKNYRDVPPSMVVSLSLFLGMVHQAGIRHIEVADYIPRRYMHFKGVKTEDERNRIQFHATDKYLRLFLRLHTQLEGFEIESYPNEVDCFMHIHLQEVLRSNNPELQSYIELGKNTSKLVGAKSKRKELIPQ